MTTAAPSTALATIQPAFTDAERLAPASGTRPVTPNGADARHGTARVPDLDPRSCPPSAGNG
jgi:hypothetical protein